MSPAPRIAVIVTTVGRPRLLDRLLLSLAGQTLPPARVLVVDQGRRPGTAAVVGHRSDRLAVHRVTSPGGTSAGRNADLVALGVLAAAAVERPSAIGTLDAMLGAPAPRPPGRAGGPRARRRRRGPGPGGRPHRAGGPGGLRRRAVPRRPHLVPAGRAGTRRPRSRGRGRRGVRPHGRRRPGPVAA
ncbi:glycosyltransferase family 2 protein, partial [Actinomadura kijaniata]|uniref:glycosyltransferase family 2 protein n=1 Tax=Actinomadura kijaniata TaxID=46161 RepID=UPI003F1AE44A